jgi:hypothetical protein
LPLTVESCDASQSNCSASQARPLFMTSEFSPIKHQPAASKRQRSSPKIETKVCRWMPVKPGMTNAI